MATYRIGLVLGTVVLLQVAALAWEVPAENPAGPQLPPMPKGYDTERQSSARGKVETVEYDSRTTGGKRKMVVYTPPGYSKDNKYPILYLLHGAKYNETSWTKDGGAHIILDNLHADKKIVPMVVVMPNGHVPAAAGFENELLSDVMPTAESRYAIQKNASHRALAGFSMGGGQSLPIGLKHLDTFAWLAGFSPAIQGKANLVPKPGDAKKIKLFYLACGDADPFFGNLANYHASLEKSKVPHIWNVFPGGQHNFAVWKNDLYQFSQLVFRNMGSANITRGGQPAELTVTSGGAHSVRVTLKPVGVVLPPSPSLLNLDIKNPAIRLRAIERPVQARVGALDIEITPAPLTVLVKSATGRDIQKLVFDDKTGKVLFNVGDAPVLGMGEGGQQAGRGSGPMGVQFDRRGKLDVMRPGWGSGTLGSRNPVAVLIGTDGWGLFVVSPWVQVDLRDPAKGAFIPTNNVKPTAGVDNPVPRGGGAQHVPAEARGFDIFVFDAGEPANMMKDLRDLTGAPALPPKWALGYMQSHRELRDAKLNPEELILDVVDTFRKKQIPVDSVAYLGTGFTPTGWNKPQPSFEFNPSVFTSDPKEVLKKLHDKNVKVVVHMRDLSAREMPNIVGNIPPGPGETLDKNHILPYWKRHEPLIKAGVDAFWPDEGDRFSIYERMTRVQMYYQGQLMTTPNVRPWTLNRNGVIGMAKWGAWMWSGDTQSRWNTLRDQIWIGLNTGLSITPYWGSDTGGFYTTSELTGELYARWLQFSAFNGSFRAHGRIWRLRTPWGWGLGDMGFREGQTALPAQQEMNNPAIEPVAKKYTELRYQLMPYTYTLAREAYDTGMPLMRALWLHYPDDEQALGQSQEYLWGRDMLIAPVYEKGATARDVYLLRGTWYDWWDNSRHNGGTTVTRKVDLATMPIYVRAGSIIPFDPVRQYMVQPVTEPTTLKIYTGADGDFTLYEDDGISQEYLKGQGTWTRLRWNDRGRELTVEPAAPQGATNVTTPRVFNVVILPEGTTASVKYDGKAVRKSWQP